jgi:dihydrodipicolinate synthase/N-acetylneuraminate lyase
MKYSVKDAKAHAKENWHGLCNVIIPSFTSDLKKLNEKAIRFDVRKNIENGFWGALLVSESATTDAEYIQFMEICVDEAKGKHNFMFHGSFDTADDIIRMGKAAESVGMEGMLLSHPNTSFPTTDKDILDYIKHIADNSKLAITTFAAPHWNFTRVHPSGYSNVALVESAKIPNVVACKYEVGGISSHYDFYLMNKNLGVLYSDPMEQHFPISVELFGQQWAGTSGFECFGNASPRMFKLLREGKHDEAMKLYWQIEPARQTRAALSGASAGANYIHRYLWKYWAWLNGYNGGPLRQPTNKISDGQMAASQTAWKKAGLVTKDEKFSDFFIGRNPA